MPLAPGVYLEEIPPPAPPPGFHTGVPAFLCVKGIAGVTAVKGKSGSQAPAGSGAAALPAEVEALLSRTDPFTRFAVRGFIENGGRRCYLIPGALDGPDGTALSQIERFEDVDLVCAPALAAWSATALARAQADILSFCAARGSRLAILDPVQDPAQLDAYRGSLTAAIGGAPGASSGALYFPWIEVAGACASCGGTGRSGGARCQSCDGTGAGVVPPSGHVAGIYARTDREVGVWKAPANAVVEGAIDLRATVAGSDLGELTAGGVNCLIALRGRGIRVWGARTLSRDPSSMFINVRRLILTLSRWLEQAMAGVVFEPNNPALWIRVSREVTALLDTLHQRGALMGASADEAYWVKCDEETNPPASRAQGNVVTEIGVAPARPSEFIVVRLVQSGRGTSAATAA